MCMVTACMVYGTMGLQLSRGTCTDYCVGLGFVRDGVRNGVRVGVRVRARVSKASLLEGLVRPHFLVRPY